MSEFSKRLKEYKKQEGLSATALAQRLGISRSALYGYLRGEYLPVKEDVLRNIEKYIDTNGLYTELQDGYLTTLRKQQRLSVSELAAICEVNPATVYRWEAGNLADITLKNALKLTHTLKCNLRDLLGGQDDISINGNVNIPIFDINAGAYGMSTPYQFIGLPFEMLNPSKQYFGLYTKDASMGNPNSLMIFEVADKVRDKQVACFTFGKSLMVRLTVVMDNEILLIPQNKDFPTYTYDNNLQVQGYLKYTLSCAN